MSKSNDHGFEWTEENIIKLIREYKIRPVLWDPKDPWFNKASYRNIGWCNIGKVLNAPSHTCKMKMLNLLSTFRREKKKRSSGWVMFPYMKFLLERSKKQRKKAKPPSTRKDGGGDRNKESAETYDLADSEPDTVKTENDDNVPVEDEESTTQPTNSNTLVKTLSNKPTQNSGAAALDQTGPSQAQMVNVQNARSNVDEEIDAFTKFVNTKMKKYPMSTVNEVQRQIFEILFKTDQTTQAPAANPGATQIIVTDVRGNNVYGYSPTATNSTQVSNNINMFHR